MSDTKDSPDERLRRLRHLACDAFLETGPGRREPVRQRLTHLDSTVTEDEAKDLEAWAEAAMREATLVAEEVRRTTRPDEVASNTSTWQSGVERLLMEYRGIDRDQANRLLGQAMIATAL